jgi:hypothetical protein
MFRLGPLSTAALIVTLGWSLSACSSSSGFDPSDLLNNDWFNSKPKLSGDRKAVFPEGVPGVPEGVPPELVKGYQEPAVATAAKEPPPSAKPAPARAQPKPRTANAPSSRPTSQPAPSSEPPPQAAWPGPNPNTFSR